ncbi:ComEC family competence protein [Roseimaritima multifibrata]|uniref:ComEC family competence protein n=1 Tax=Roseimaritima multifibrata TaxID=1930274 RepID=A0A517MNG4_9BACT|nr:ComEC/Rec2 family competence protein [Roseimaritima multifibrata]QDS96414.1 ComEC family competence protein [Roseimaritima multifibrata]
MQYDKIMTGQERLSSESSRLGMYVDRHLLRRYPLITFSLAAAAGIQGSLWSWWFAITGILLAGLFFWGSRRWSQRRLGWLAVLCCVAVVFSVHARERQQQTRLASLNRYVTVDWQPAILQVAVTGSVERKPNRLAQMRGREEEWQTVFDVRVERIRIGQDWHPVFGGARVSVDADASSCLPGDVLVLLGGIQSIPPPRNPGEPDMRPIYAARGQQARIRVDGLTQIEKIGQHFSLQRPFARFGIRGDKTLDQRLSPGSAPLAAALVLGRREAVERQQREQLLATGTAHLLSVSGLHLGMVALAVSWLLALTTLSHGKQYLIILVACVAYAAVTGGRPPVMRAALLVGTMLLGLWSGRTIHPLNALALAAAILLVWNPANLTRVGVQLSFLAVGTLIVAARQVSGLAAAGQSEDPLERLIDARVGWGQRFFRVSRRRGWLAFQFSFWVWAVTAPLVWFYFHIVSPISVLANVLLGVPLLVALLSGLSTVLLGALFQPAASVPAAVCDSSLLLIRRLIGGLAEVPGGHFWMPSPPGWWVVSFYGLLGLAVLASQLWRLAWFKHRAAWLIGWLFLWGAIAWPLATVYRSRVLHAIPPGGMEVTFVDVGHGTSVLIRSEGGPVWLYDCGRLGAPAQSSRPIEAVLWECGIVHLDTIVLSHADSDHYNALPGLLARFSVGRVITPPGMLEDEERGLEPIREAIQRHQIPSEERSSGTVLTFGKETSAISVLHPPQERLPGNDNVNSLVLQVVHRGTTLFLPGDIELPGTDLLLQYPRPPGGGLLMAPHHGSLQEDMRPLLDWSRPRTVVVSGGERAGRPEVLAAMGQHGSEVFVTALEGAVVFHLDADGTVRKVP